MKKTTKKIVSILLCLLIVSGTFVLDFGTVTSNAAETQKAMFLFKNTLYITCNAANHAYNSSYPYRKPIDIIDNLSGNGNAYAPFDCKVVAKHTSEGNTVAFESLEKVQFADGTIDYMTFMVAHDDNISNISIGNTYSQGTVIYQEGNAGTSSGSHIHLEVARGAYSKRSNSSQSIWSFIRSQSNVMYPHNAFYLYEGTKISNNGGYSWKVATSSYTLTYDANGGSGAPSAQTGATTYTISSTIPTRFGYTFDGWSDGRYIYFSGNSITLSQNTTLYATWVNDDDMPYIRSPYQEVYYKYVPASSGYHAIEALPLGGSDNMDIKGYLYDSAGNELAYNDDRGVDSGFDSSEAHDFRIVHYLTGGNTYYIKVTAWSGKTGSIFISPCKIPELYYNANGGNGAPSSQVETDWALTDLNYTISSVTPTRTDYTFLGWSTNSNATYADYQPGSSIEMYYDDDGLTLYAVWQYNPPTTYTVSYNANGGTGAPSSQTKTHDISLTLTSSVPTKKYTITYNANGGSVSPSSKTLNCKFIKWNTAANGSGTSYNSGATYSANSNVTLYAQYATPTAGTLATPTRSGYTFDGWYTAANGGTKITTSTVISKNTTVYAHWTKKAEPTTKPAVTLSSISVKTNPSKTAYTVGETFNSSGLSLTAKYSDGTSKTITSGFTCSKPDMTTAGTKKVTVTYQGKTTNFNITVKEAVVKATSVDIYVIEEFNGTNTAKIGATVNPSNASYKSITWTSSDTSVATVDSEGTIKTYNAGVAIITVTVTNHDGTTVSDTIEVTVNGSNNSGGGFLGFLMAMLELLFLPFTFLFAILFG